MASFKNKMGIGHIHMYGIKRRFFCPIGESECTYEIDIEMDPDNIICDYLKVNAFIEDMDDEQTLESACAAICNYMANTYQPYIVVVSVKCQDAEHMPVEVTKTIRTESYDRSMKKLLDLMEKGNSIR